MNFIINQIFVENSIKYVIIRDNALTSIALQKDLFKYNCS
jgi:hypothetical protein